MKNKRAISLIVLVITIVLVLILVSTITVSTVSAIENARILTFAEDLKKVEDAVTIYFQQYNKFPTIGEEKALSKEEVLNKVPEVSKKEFNNELDLNHDNVENDKLGSFYAIDLGKLDVEETLRGIQRDEEGNPNPSDLYVVAYPSMNVYYLQGLSAKQTFYFSLSPKMNRVVKITSDMVINEENSNITSMADVTVKREKKTWTNKLNILIEANILPNEKLFVSIEEGARHQIIASTGFHNFYFKDSFSQIIDNVDGSVIDTGINSEEIERFHKQAQEDKKMIITKERDNTVVGEIVVDLSNYDVDLPAKTSDTSIKSDAYNNVVKFQVADETSNIASVKYEYLREYDENADANLYYDEVEVYDASYLYTRGKEARLQEDGTVEIAVPKDVEGIQLRAFDTAGNASKSINENTTVPVYIGIHEKNPTKTSVNLKNVIKTDKKINSATIQLSADNQNYTQAQELNLKDMGNGIYKAPVDCENLVGIEEKIYIKVNVNYENNQTETRIKEISVYEEVEELGEGTRIEEESSFKTPYVPNGFDYLEGSVEQGYVIKDKENGNEFVWIPVKDKENFSRGVIGDHRDLTNYTEKNEKLNQNIFDSVAKHGGFYLGRYETRYQGDAKLDFSKQDTYLQGEITPVIAKEYPVWNYISLNYAKQIAESMYQGKTKSSLITSSAFDTTLNWLIESGQKTMEEVVVDSSNWGNYLNSSIDEITVFMDETTNQAVKSKEKKNKAEKESLLIYSTDSQKTKANEIYDLAGNVYEWTTETYFDEGIGRGGRYNSFGYDRPASYRFTSKVNDASNQDVGFRVMLYW